MSELSTLALADAGDAREIAEMSRDLIEQGLTWSWTPARVQHFISGAESSVVVARRARVGDSWGDGSGSDARHSEFPRVAAPRVAAPRIAAFAIMHFGDDVAHLNLLAVAPEYRRQGLGRQLMDWLTLTAIEAGVFRINLEVRTQNDQARAFYENLGFVSRGVVQGYYQGREAALRMSRRLATNQC
jgi:ribosomal protein S18 acetylase RimI-like enzyme